MKDKLRYILYTISLFFIYLLVNYIDSQWAKYEVQEKYKKDVASVIEEVKLSMDSAKIREKAYENAISENLRRDSIIIQKSLPPNIENVSNEQLITLAKKLDLEGITLLTPYNDDGFIAEKSSDPNEIGILTNKWGKWNDVLLDLKRNKQASPMSDFGEFLNNFWAGPIDRSETNHESFEKMGYYYDGTTDYIIDPYISEAQLVNFKRSSMVYAEIKENMKEFPYILDITVLDKRILTNKKLNGDYTLNNEWVEDHVVLYGDYKYSDRAEINIMENVLSQNVQVENEQSYKGSAIIKSYTPISMNSDGKPNQVLVVTSDVRYIEELAENHTKNFLICSSIILVFLLLSLFFIDRYRKRGKMITTVQNRYYSDMDVILRTMKSHRLDYKDQLFAIMGFVSLKKYDELEKYLKNLSQTSKPIHGVVALNPAFNEMFYSKIIVAFQNNIEMEHHFEGFERVKIIDPIKEADILKLLSHTIDSVIEVVKNETNVSPKRIIIISVVKNKHISVRIHFVQKQDVFNCDLNSGIIAKYNGTIEIVRNGEWSIVSIKTPLLDSEKLAVGLTG